MRVSTTKITLEEFLNLPHIDDSTAWEYIDGVAIRKPMPKIRHSLLQKRLLTAIDACSDEYTALPELRCTYSSRSRAKRVYAGRSIVPDIAGMGANSSQ